MKRGSAGLSSAAPDLAGAPITLRFEPRLAVRRGRLSGSGIAVHAATWPSRRLIVLDAALRARPRELRRIYVHELFHFVWVRLGNSDRRAWEAVLAVEMRRRARGELGWSSEQRGGSLSPSECAERTRAWREYACESFCDTAAWLYGGLPRHDEWTLAPLWRERRRHWFDALLESRGGVLPI